MPAKFKDADGKVVELSSVDASAPLEALANNPYFKILGYMPTDAGPAFFIYSKRGKATIALRADRIRKETVATFAPSSYLQVLFPATENTTERVDALREAIIGVAFKRGVYSPDRIRGIGVWRDDGRLIFHGGDRLIVDGKATEIGECESLYSYEAGVTQPIALDRPLTAAEGENYYQLLSMLSWIRPESPALLAGWLFVSRICGALSWRPHAWISAPPGAGKSWVMTKLISPALGDLALEVLGGVTEPALRQTLRCDARPVIFDEAEGERESSAERIQAILGLMRQASSETKARILKGGSDGRPSAYSIRASFLCASIAAGIVQSSDETRVTALELGPPRSAEAFKSISARQREAVTIDLAERITARALSMIKIIDQCVVTFGDAIEAHIGSRRLADQVGTLLAGWWCLTNDAAVTDERAAEVVAIYQWESEMITHEETDPIRCLRHLLEWPLRADGANAVHSLSAAELVAIGAGLVTHRDLSADAASSTLLRHGLKISPSADLLIVAARHSALAARLKGTPYAVGWHKVLQYVPGATGFNKTHRFGPALTSRSISVPLRGLVENHLSQMECPF